MMTEHEMLSRIKWDKKCEPAEFTVQYLDLKRLASIPYSAIKKIESGFMVIDKDGRDVDIPLHRIRVIRRKGEIVWQRK